MMTIATQQMDTTSSPLNGDTLTYLNRNQNALQRRAQQLRRWQENEELELANGLSSRTRSKTRVCFSASTLFLSACAQNDLIEAERLLKSGELKGGIDVADSDGLTALHQACIDDNEKLVEWLLKNGANINCKDNEGWTPLHASANFGNINIVTQLLARPKCDVNALNCDNELACDVSDNPECVEKIRNRMALICGIAPPSADEDEPEEFANLRHNELKSIERDVDIWSSKKDQSNFDVMAEFERTRDPISGATILHVCAAKGYNEALDRLLGAFDGTIDIDSLRDYDGFTPLHAAAFWKQPETFETLLKFGSNPELPTPKTAENSLSSSVLELCKNDPKFVELVESSKERFAKESETQRKIHAKRQREGRRSTQGVKKEDLENALKMMHSANPSTNTETAEDSNSIISLSAESSVQEMETESLPSSGAQYTTAAKTTVSPSSTTSTGDTAGNTMIIQRSNSSDNDGAPTTFKIRLPSRNKTLTTSTTASLNALSSSISQTNNSSSLQNTEPEIPTVTLYRTTDTIPPFSQPDTDVSLTTSISPSDPARRRKIKRRATGIEDDTGSALSPESFPPDMNPFAKKDDNGSINKASTDRDNKTSSDKEPSLIVKPVEAISVTTTTPAQTSSSVDAAFDVILSTSNQPRSRIIQKPVSAASSSTSLNSFKSAASDDNDGRGYSSTSMQSLDQIDSRDSRPNGFSSSTRSLNAPISDTDIKNITSGADDIDYKKLCRQLLRENEALKRRIKELEEAEKKRDQDFGRERRSMQRTISEHEEELKSMQELKAENVKLKDDNAALIRVISKLSK